MPKNMDHSNKTFQIITQIIIPMIRKIIP